MGTIKLGSDIIRFALYKDGLDCGVKNGWVKAETPVRSLWDCPGERKRGLGSGPEGGQEVDSGGRSCEVSRRGLMIDEYGGQGRRMEGRVDNDL